MISVDAVVVGGGPAGSTCAWKLREAGVDVLVLDRAKFPRTKLCAGWVTPAVMADLELKLEDYPLSLMTFEELQLHWRVFTRKLDAPQHSIRRVEFDDFLLRRAKARVERHKVRDIASRDGCFVIDNTYRCKYLIGAGGTACPVYRSLFRDRNPRNAGLQTATLEQEFKYDWRDPACHLWFFEHGLPGYAWYVPKANGHINVGLGGMAVKLHHSKRNLHEHWRRFARKLDAVGLVHYAKYRPSGYSYYLRGVVDHVRDGNAFLVGDAVGLATVDMCEGIGPAIKSGLRAARAIIADADYSLADISRFTVGGLPGRLLERRFAHVNTATIEAQ